MFRVELAGRLRVSLMLAPIIFYFRQAQRRKISWCNARLQSYIPQDSRYTVAKYNLMGRQSFAHNPVCPMYWNQGFFIYPGSNLSNIFPNRQPVLELYFPDFNYSGAVDILDSPLLHVPNLGKTETLGRSKDCPRLFNLLSTL